jgi:hypothetical protein
MLHDNPKLLNSKCKDINQSLFYYYFERNQDIKEMRYKQHFCSHRIVGVLVIVLWDLSFKFVSLFKAHKPNWRMYSPESIILLGHW